MRRRLAVVLLAPAVALLLELAESRAAAQTTKEEPKPVWNANLDKALAQAEKEGKPVFIDFTGLT
jgi:hypothetical protein